MTAFVTSLSPLPTSPPRSGTLRRMRKPRMTVSVPENPKPSRQNLQRRSVIALRGLSDLGGMTILHELTARLILPTTLTASMAADTQLLLGGLVGVWTAALFAERMRFETMSLIRETEQLPSRWDASIIYTPSLEENEVDDAVAWLYAFEELDGLAAADMLTALASAGSPTTRLRLAEALSSYPVPSNVSASVLTALQNDTNPLVRRAAQSALQTLQTPLLVSSSTDGSDVLQPSADPEHDYARAVLDRIFEQSANPYLIPFDEERALPASLANDSQAGWLRELVADRVECMGKAALSKPDLRQLRASVVRDSHLPQNPVDVTALRSADINVPLFEGLKWSEIHGLCTLAILPAAYELLSLLDGVDLPLRFVGLGWLLAFGGLVAYPQSGDLWRKLKKLTDEKIIS
ncbi:hypothetical protein FGB62_12g126 [Gracilaria domingensis]|nr:hypothetical protein FGB62_12g126 [Gracilaria domingensis]